MVKFHLPCKMGKSAMKPLKFIINSQDTLTRFLGEAAKLWREHRFMKVTLSFGRDRSLEQNALIHKWFGDISEQRGENTPAEITVICTRQFFVPILRADDEEFNAILDSLSGMAEDEKMYLIELLPVTSICSVKQMSRGMDDMFLHYSGMGVELTQPEEEK